MLRRTFLSALVSLSGLCVIRSNRLRYVRRVGYIKVMGGEGELFEFWKYYQCQLWPEFFLRLQYGEKLIVQQYQLVKNACHAGVLCVCDPDACQAAIDRYHAIEVYNER